MIGTAGLKATISFPKLLWDNTLYPISEIRGVEQWQLEWLITIRSPVRVRPPQPSLALGNCRYEGAPSLHPATSYDDGSRQQ